MVYNDKTFTMVWELFIQPSVSCWWSISLIRISVQIYIFKEQGISRKIFQPLYNRKLYTWMFCILFSLPSFCAISHRPDLQVYIFHRNVNLYKYPHFRSLSLDLLNWTIDFIFHVAAFIFQFSFFKFFIKSSPLYFLSFHISTKHIATSET